MELLQINPLFLLEVFQQQIFNFKLMLLNSRLLQLICFFLLLGVGVLAHVCLDVFAFSKGTANTLVFYFVKFKVLWKTNAEVMIPHITKITTEHKGSVFRLPTYAKELFFMRITHFVVTHDLFEVFNWSYFQNCSSEDFPHSNREFERFQKIKEVLIAAFGDFHSIFDMLFELIE